MCGFIAYSIQKKPATKASRIEKSGMLGTYCTVDDLDKGAQSHILRRFIGL